MVRRRPIISRYDGDEMKLIEYVARHARCSVEQLQKQALVRLCRDAFASMKEALRNVHAETPVEAPLSTIQSTASQPENSNHTGDGT